MTTANTGERRRLSPADGKCGLFNRGHGLSNPQGLILLTEGADRDVDRDGDLWRQDLSPDTNMNFASYGCPTPVYEEGEERSVEYFIWADFESETYMDPGTYRFEAPIRAWDVDANFEKDEPLAQFDWGFDIELRESS